MSNKSATEGWYAQTERTSQTDDQRIKDVTQPCCRPEHLIRFFPIAGTPTEKLIGTRARRSATSCRQGRPLLVVMGPCSIHDPAAALEYAVA